MIERDLAAIPRMVAALLAPVGMLLVGVLSGAETVILGAGLTLDRATPIHAILADPDAYVGQVVRIEGGVLDVCPMKGCWVEVGGEDASLRIKVEDDVIVFPADAKGKILAAQGTVEAVDMTRDDYVAWLVHLAEEKGEPFDPAVIGDGPFRSVRIAGSGARLDG